MVRSLAESKIISGEPGAYCLARAVDAIQVPSTVQAVLAARVNRLPADEKRLLQCAAVIGTKVPQMILEAVVGLPPNQFRQNLANLQKTQMLYERSLFPDPEYAFNHYLTYEVAYATLTLKQRKALHKKIASVIEEQSEERRAEQVERLAYHCFRAAEWDKAATYLRQASARAMAHYAYSEAARLLEDALAALKQLPTSPENIRLGIDIHLDLRNAVVPAGDIEIVLGYLERAEILAESLNDRRRMGWVSSYIGAGLWSIGKYKDAFERASRNRALAMEAGDPQLRIYANLSLCWACHCLGRYAEGIEAGEEALSLLRTERVEEDLPLLSLQEVNANAWLALLQAERGSFANAIKCGEEAVRLAETAGEPWGRLSACLGLGGAHLCRCSYTIGRAVLEQGMQILQRFKIDAWYLPISALLGHAYTHSGRLSDGIALLTSAAEERDAKRFKFLNATAMVWLSEALILADRLGEARKWAEKAVDFSTDLGEAGNRAYALRVLGEIAIKSEQPRLDDAECYYKEALQLAESLEMKPLIARCSIGLGQAGHRLGRNYWATHLSNAAKLLKEMGMVTFDRPVDLLLDEFGAKAPLLENL